MRRSLRRIDNCFRGNRADMKQRESNAKNSPSNDQFRSSHERSRIRNWLLLYFPFRTRAWLYRIPFYILVFFVAPFLSIAALGAYLGPDQTFGGVASIMVIVFLAIIVRRSAVRADFGFGRSAEHNDGHRLIEGWLFPLEDPPPRRLVLGYALSATGTFLILLGFLGGGLAANAVIWPILIFFHVPIDGLVPPPVPVMTFLAVSALTIGSVISVFGFVAGPQLRNRGRRLRAGDARRLVQRPGERSVLLLRSFEDEELVDPRPLNFFQQRYEENLIRVLNKLGPVITVGRPGDDLGFSGAARFYVSDDNWQQAIRYLMTHTAAVVIIVGGTGGLWWEIATALECVSRERLLFFVPLVNKERQTGSWYRYGAEFVKRWNLSRSLFKQMEVERRARYRIFRQRSAELLGDTLPEDLNNAFFFDFHPDGRVRILRSRYGLLRHYLVDIIPRYRQVRFNMYCTLWPFMEKIYETSN